MSPRIEVVRIDAVQEYQYVLVTIVARGLIGPVNRADVGSSGGPERRHKPFLLERLQIGRRFS
jgi:hypothetical protein